MTTQRPATDTTAGDAGAGGPAGATFLVVDDDAILGAMRLVWERMKIVIEPSAATPVAALLERPELFGARRVAVVLSGGNVDLDALPF